MTVTAMTLDDLRREVVASVRADVSVCCRQEAWDHRRDNGSVDVTWSIAAVGDDSYVCEGKGATPEAALDAFRKDLPNRFRVGALVPVESELQNDRAEEIPL